MKKITLLLAVLISSYGFAQQTISFEASEGYTLGNINGQNGWTSTGDGSGGFLTNQVVSNELATDGTNSFKIQEETAFGTQQSPIMGGFYTYPQPINHTDAIISADVYISEIDGADFRFGTVNTAAETYTLILDFVYDGSIRVVDNDVFETTGTTWTPQTWYEVKMVTNGANVTYYIDNVEIYSGNQIAMEDITQLRFVHDNWGGFAYMDNIQTTDGTLSTVSQTLDQVSLYPNPAKDFLNVQVPSNVEITGAVLYDVLGKNTGVVISNGQMNVSTLSRGVYMLSLETTAGSLVRKVVKQ